MRASHRHSVSVRPEPAPYPGGSADRPGRRGSRRRRSAWAPGPIWAQVVTAAAAPGLAPLCASSTSVGVAGYTLGGGRARSAAATASPRTTCTGRGWSPRTGDRTRSTPTAPPSCSGAARCGAPASASSPSWSSRCSRSPACTGGGLFLPGSAAAELLHLWRQWAPMLPDEAGTSVALLRPPTTRVIGALAPWSLGRGAAELSRARNRPGHSGRAPTERGCGAAGRRPGRHVRQDPLP